MSILKPVLLSSFLIVIESAFVAGSFARANQPLQEKIQNKQKFEYRVALDLAIDPTICSPNDGEDDWKVEIINSDTGKVLTSQLTNDNFTSYSTYPGTAGDNCKVRFHIDHSFTHDQDRINLKIILTEEDFFFDDIYEVMTIALSSDQDIGYYAVSRTDRELVKKSVTRETNSRLLHITSGDTVKSIESKDELTLIEEINRLSVQNIMAVTLRRVQSVEK